MLVAEDDRREWEIIGNALKYFGMRNLVFADSGARAKEILSDALRHRKVCPVDLTLIDLRSESGVSSAELLRYIRGEERLKPLPVVVLMSDATVESVQELSRLGVSGILLRPVSPSDIGEKLSEVLMHHSPLCQGRLAG